MKRAVYIPDDLWKLVEEQCNRFGIDPPNLSWLLQERLMQDFHIEEQKRFTVVEPEEGKK